MRKLLLLSLLGLASYASAGKPITITFLHSNDLHAHVEPTVIGGRSYGGYARLATIIERERAVTKNLLLLDAGDVFQGTLYFNVYKGKADLAYMNTVRYDAMVLGNHEFDQGPAVLGEFIKEAKFPVLSSNLDVRNEPNLKDLVKPYTVLTVGGEKVGIVGATTKGTPSISSPGPNLKFLDEAESVQKSVDELTKQGIDKIVVLTHMGYEEDMELATKLRNVDLIIGGHSHTPLGTPAISGWPAARGPYPSRVNQTYVVQAWEWGKALGKIVLNFNAQGEATVDFAKPIVVDESIPEEPMVKKLLAALEAPIHNMKNQQIGTAAMALPRGKAMGYLIADGMLEATRSTGSVAAFVNAGGVRAALRQGPITYGDAVTVQPFQNTLVILEVTGAELKGAMESGAVGGGMLIPSAGTSYLIDRSLPGGRRVSSVMIGGRPLSATERYKITLLSFTAAGGDAHNNFKNARGYRLDTGFLDIDAFVAYLKTHSPVRTVGERLIER